MPNTTTALLLQAMKNELLNIENDLQTKVETRTNINENLFGQLRPL